MVLASTMGSLGAIITIDIITIGRRAIGRHHVLPLDLRHVLPLNRQVAHPDHLNCLHDKKVLTALLLRSLFTEYYSDTSWRGVDYSWPFLQLLKILSSLF